MNRQKHNTDTAIAQAMLHTEKVSYQHSLRSADYQILWHESQIYTARATPCVEQG